MEIIDIEGTSDIYVIDYIDQKERKKADIHFTCQTGRQVLIRDGKSWYE